MKLGASRHQDRRRRARCGVDSGGRAELWDECMHPASGIKEVSPSHDGTHLLRALKAPWTAAGAANASTPLPKSLDEHIATCDLFLPRPRPFHVVPIPLCGVPSPFRAGLSPFYLAPSPLYLTQAPLLF